jgi:hypothetical protein
MGTRRKRAPISETPDTRTIKITVLIENCTKPERRRMAAVLKQVAEKIQNSPTIAAYAGTGYAFDVVEKKPLIEL